MFSYLDRYESEYEWIQSWREPVLTHEVVMSGHPNTMHHDMRLTEEYRAPTALMRVGLSIVGIALRCFRRLTSSRARDTDWTTLLF